MKKLCYWLGAMVLLVTSPARVAAVYATINIDGDFSDWTPAMVVGSDAQSDVTGGSLDWKQISIANDDDYVYFRFEAWTVSQAWTTTSGSSLTMWLDTDNNDATGFHPFGSSFGSELMYALDLYSEANGGYVDATIGSVAIAPTIWPIVPASSWECRIPRNAVHPTSLATSVPLRGRPLFGPEGTQFKLLLAAMNGPTDLLPNDTSAANAVTYTMAANPAYASVYKQITIDGDVGEWPAQALVYSDAQGDSSKPLDLKAIWVANDENNIYMRVDAWTPVAAYSGSDYALTSFIDCDNLTISGFNAFGFGTVGSDLMHAFDLYSEADGGYNEGYLGAAASGPSLLGGAAASSWEIAFPRTLTHPAASSLAVRNQPVFGGAGSVLSFLTVTDTGTPGDRMPESGGKVHYRIAATPPAPVLQTVAVVDDTHIDVTFSLAMGPDALVAANYTVSGTGKGSLADHPAAVALVSGNTYRLTWSAGVQAGAGLDITITADAAVESAENAPLGSTNNSATAVGGAVPVELSGWTLE